MNIAWLQIYKWCFIGKTHFIEQRGRGLTWSAWGFPFTVMWLHVLMIHNLKGDHKEVQNLHACMHDIIYQLAISNAWNACMVIYASSA